MQKNLATDVAVNFVGDYVQRGTRRAPEGKNACFECGDNSHFMKDSPSCLAEIENCKGNRECSKNGDNGNLTGKQSEKNS